MTRDEALAIAASAICDVAPDAAARIPALDQAADLRRTLDLDSMDMLAIAEAIALRIGADLPGDESARTIDGLVTAILTASGG